MKYIKSFVSFGRKKTFCQKFPRFQNELPKNDFFPSLKDHHVFTHYSQDMKGLKKILLS